MNDLEKLHRALKHTPVRDPGGVFMAWLSRGEVKARFMDSVLQTYIRDALTGNRHLLRQGNGYECIVGSDIAGGRNDIVRKFLTRSIEWLLMVDDDMTFPPDALEKLLASADPKLRPVVGGLCFGGGRGSIYPTMYRLVDPKENDGDPRGHVNEWEDGELVKVDATGAAFLLIHRSVLVRMLEVFGEGTPAAPWFSFSAYKGFPFSEDWTFCLRLMQLEVPLYVNTAVKIGHEKSVVMDEAMWRGGSPLRSVGLDGKVDSEPIPLKEPA